MIDPGAAAGSLGVRGAHPKHDRMERSPARWVGGGVPSDGIVIRLYGAAPEGRDGHSRWSVSTRAYSFII